MDLKALLMASTAAPYLCRCLLAAAWLTCCAALPGIADESLALDGNDVAAQFRGCDAAGWCRFSVEPGSESVYRVRPDGVAWGPDGSDSAVAVRDRLNALLSSMIHQHKRIVLIGARRLEDGSYEATVIVNEADVANDEVLEAVTGDE
jgi:hypothetical protein